MTVYIPPIARNTSIQQSDGTFINISGRSINAQSILAANESVNALTVTGSLTGPIGAFDTLNAQQYLLNGQVFGGTGPTGPIGTDGADGANGSTGPTGSAGPTGPTAGTVSSFSKTYHAKNTTSSQSAPVDNLRVTFPNPGTNTIGSDIQVTNSGGTFTYKGATPTTWMISFTVRSDNCTSAKMFNIWVFKNGSGLNGQQLVWTGGQYNALSTTAIIPMSLNDNIECMFYTSSVGSTIGQDGTGSSNSIITILQ